MAVEIRQSGYDLAAVLENSVGMNLYLSYFGKKKKLRPAEFHLVATDGFGNEADQADQANQANQSMVTAQKTLFVSPEYQRITRLGGEIKTYVKLKTLPSPLRGGIWMVPNVLVDEVDAQLGALKAERAARVDAFLAVYDDVRLAAQAELGALFNPQDYPSHDRVRRAFVFDWEYLTYGTPDSLSSRLFQQEKEKAVSRFSEWSQEMNTLLRANMQELVGHLAEKLTGERDGGKPKIFRDSAVENVREFLSTFDARNLTDDKALADCVTQAKALLEGVDGDALRNSPGTRDTVRDGFSALQGALDAMLRDAPNRKIRLGEGNDDE